jgi:membrane-associated protease RseP (regulator of RpoE activity)
MQIFLTILILIVMLGILIAAHEAGHLALAKAFNVYCLEYSIGFGPKIFSHTKKGGETAFSLRCIPLGGYVSMYGEGVDLPEGVSVPPERSLQGISWWKRSLILVAGIVVNLILSFLFVMVYSTCFPSVKSYESYNTDWTNEKGEAVRIYGLRGTYSGNQMVFDEDNDVVYTPGTLYSESDGNLGGFLIDTQASIVEAGSSTPTMMVALYSPATLEGSNDLASCLQFYLPAANFTPSDLRTAQGIYALPDFTKRYNVTVGDRLTLHLRLYVDADPQGENKSLTMSDYQAVTLTDEATLKDSTASFATVGLATTSSEYYGSFASRWNEGCSRWVYFFSAMGAGFKALFTFDFSQVGGVVAMGASINQLSAYAGVGRTFFLYGGFISLNLALFNLLPFPGLDGWQLLVTIVEAIAHKKVPEKAKNIVSMVGLCLLFVLAIFITVKDVITYLV